MRANWNPDDLTYDFAITNQEGHHLLTLRGFEVAKHSSGFDSGVTRRFDVVEAPVDALSIPIPPSLIIDQKPYQYVRFVRGHEMDMQRALLRLDQNTPNLVWICASSGVDGATARGLSRSLRKEIPAWDIRLVIFPENWASEAREAAISFLTSSGNIEQEITVGKSGTVTSPRFELSEAPTRRVLKHNMKWEVVGNRSISCSRPSFVPVGSLLVEVEYISASEGGLRGFYGEVSTGAHAGKKVLGVTDKPLSNYVLVPEGWTMQTDACVQKKEVLPALALGALAAGLALGLSTLVQPSRANQIRVLVAGSDNTVTPSLASALSILGIRHHVIQTLSLEHLAVISSSDLVISGYSSEADIQLVKSALSAHSSLVLWSDPVSGMLATIRKQTWLPNDSITVLIRRLADHCENDTQLARSLPPAEMLDALHLPPVAISQSLFDASRAYLLVGGVGSLGVHIALWMYQVCTGSLASCRWC